MLLLWFTISVIVCLHVCLGKMFTLDSRLAILGRNCPFGFLLVVFFLWCRYFKRVLFPFDVLERKVLGYCIKSRSLPSCLFVEQTPFQKGISVQEVNNVSLERMTEKLPNIYPFLRIRKKKKKKKKKKNTNFDAFPT